MLRINIWMSGHPQENQKLALASAAAGFGHFGHVSAVLSMNKNDPNYAACLAILLKQPNLHYRNDKDGLTVTLSFWPNNRIYTSNVLLNKGIQPKYQTMEQDMKSEDENPDGSVIIHHIVDKKKFQAQNEMKELKKSKKDIENKISTFKCDETPESPVFKLLETYLYLIENLNDMKIKKEFNKRISHSIEEYIKLNFLILKNKYEGKDTRFLEAKKITSKVSLNTLIENNNNRFSNTNNNLIMITKYIEELEILHNEVSPSIEAKNLINLIENLIEVAMKINALDIEQRDNIYQPAAEAKLISLVEKDSKIKFEIIQLRITKKELEDSLPNLKNTFSVNDHNLSSSLKMIETYLYWQKNQIELLLTKNHLDMKEKKIMELLNDIDRLIDNQDISSLIIEYRLLKPNNFNKKYELLKLICAVENSSSELKEIKRNFEKLYLEMTQLTQTEYTISARVSIMEEKLSSGTLPPVIKQLREIIASINNLTEQIDNHLIEQANLKNEINQFSTEGKNPDDIISFSTSNFFDAMELIKFIIKITKEQKQYKLLGDNCALVIRKLILAGLIPKRIEEMKYQLCIPDKFFYLPATPDYPENLKKWVVKLQNHINTMNASCHHKSESNKTDDRVNVTQTAITFFNKVNKNLDEKLLQETLKYRLIEFAKNYKNKLINDLIQRVAALPSNCGLTDFLNVIGSHGHSHRNNKKLEQVFKQMIIMVRGCMNENAYSGYYLNLLKIASNPPPCELPSLTDNDAFSTAFQQYDRDKYLAFVLKDIEAEMRQRAEKKQVANGP